MAENNHPGDAGSENPKVVDDKSVGGNAAAADNILAGVDCGAGDIGDNLDFVQLDVDQHLEEAFAHFDGLPFLTLLHRKPLEEQSFVSQTKNLPLSQLY